MYFARNRLIGQYMKTLELTVSQIQLLKISSSVNYLNEYESIFIFNLGVVS